LQAPGVGGALGQPAKGTGIPKLRELVRLWLQ
jgi:hypothetical protein